MARNTGPVCRMCRREQAKLFLKGEKCFTNCTLDRRPTPPGVARPQRGKPSEYQIRLREKQKLRRMTMMTERPFARMMEKAAKTPGKTAESLMRSLETRLDSVVRRLGFATSLAAARQLVLHGSIRLNGRGINIPSHHVKVGDVVSLNPKLKDNAAIKLSLEFAEKKATRPAFLEFKAEDLSGKLLREPSREEASFPVNDQLVVEYYSR